ncbi:MAG: NADPH-dependent assimilatory sulfite reductase hemoprotein subunit [Gammaproteobacteria bacterium]|nr:NADPH-dependent assimilatory sulfite reductase hemoprotein subunit [Gammaproteobacteria bacterium]
MDIERSADRSRPVAELHPNERLKDESRQLRGTIAQGLADPVTGAIRDPDTQLSKFFGIYQQDDRDLRDARRRARLEPRYQFMVRVRMPGGVCSTAQWLALDALARDTADGSLRLTTRQTFQFHGVRKRDLKRHVKAIAAAGLDTLGACGDVNRNVISAANPLRSPAHAAANELAQRIGAHLLPRTGAYREIFLEEDGVRPGDPVAGPDATGGEEEPFYGRTYLPRKFKIAIAVPPQNDVDVYAHDLGYVAIVERGHLAGYDVTVGGGMGMTHGATATFPRVADVVGFCRPEEALSVAEHTVAIQRDFGHRKDRAHARFKYTIEDRGLDWFRAELARRMGRPLDPARGFRFESTGDENGWREDSAGLWHYTLFVENGRVRDRPDQRLMSALRAVARVHGGSFALTTNQNLIIAGVAAGERGAIDALLHEHGVGERPGRSGLRLNSIACVALPTCGLAMAESERYLPTLLDRLEPLLAAASLTQAPITIRMSGCPNGCSRPYLAEIALVGKAPGRYNLYLGASARGDRMSALYRENLDEAAILQHLGSLLQRYASERIGDERFGDFTVRIGAVPAVERSRDFQHLRAT